MIANIQTLLDAGLVSNAPGLTNPGPFMDIQVGGQVWEPNDSESTQRVLDPTAPVTDLSEHFSTSDIPAMGYILRPHTRCVVWSKEFFVMPHDVSGLVMLRSRAAQAGLDHAFSGGIKPGWSGFLALELYNTNAHAALQIRPGDKVAQVCFFKLTD